MYGNASESAQEISNRRSTLEPMVYTQNHSAGVAVAGERWSLEATMSWPIKPSQHSQHWEWELDLFQPLTLWLDIPLTAVLLRYAPFHP